MAPKIETVDVKDVFQEGLRRGAAKLPYAPHKRYFYVEHPEEGWRVYLRSACFLHPLYEPYRAEHFLVVKRTGGDAAKASWEPPKGQMEGKDGGGGAPGGATAGGGRARAPTVFSLLKENIRREVAEEAKVSKIRDLWHTGIVLQSVEPDFPPNTFFQYHVFSGYVHPTQLTKAFQEFEWIAANPAEFEQMKSDQREKDALAWSDEGAKKKMMGRWSPTLVRLYLEKFGGGGGGAQGKR